MEYIRAFLVGGLICAAVQLLLDRTKLMPGRIMVSLVVTGAVLGFLGIYEPFAQWAGAGATVPLTGFGNTLWKGIARAMGEDGILGIFKGGFTASAVGISGALVCGYLGSLVFKPKMKGQNGRLYSRPARSLIFCWKLMTVCSYSEFMNGDVIRKSAVALLLAMGIS